MLGVCKHPLTPLSFLPFPPFFPLLISLPPSSPLPPSLPSRIDDEQLEVIGLYSFLHVGKIQVSLAEPLRVGQASKIKVQSSHYICGRGAGEAVHACAAWYRRGCPVLVSRSSLAKAMITYTPKRQVAASFFPCLWVGS